MEAPMTQTTTSAKPRKLTPAQITMLLRLRRSTNHEEMTPTGSRQAALSAANWYRTCDILIGLGLATKHPAGGARRVRLTIEGIIEADALLAKQP